MRTLLIAMTTIGMAYSQQGDETVTERLGTLEFKRPARWIMNATPEGVMVLPAEAKARLDKGFLDELYIVSVLPGVANLQDPKLKDLASSVFPATASAKTIGKPREFPAAARNGYVHGWEFRTEMGELIRLHMYVVALKGGGAAAVTAMAAPAVVESRDRDLTAMAASITSMSSAKIPTENSPLTQKWDVKLRGAKLFQFSSYASSPGSGGMNSQRKLWLHNNGEWEYTSSSSVYMSGSGYNAGSAGRGAETGTWRIFTQNGQAYLELKSAAGQTDAMLLEDRAGRTHINGARWLVSKE